MKRTTLDLPRFGAGTGLTRTARLAGRLGLDLPALGRRSVVITGSNGKGSTASLLTALLCEAGESVGTFTSPHLFAFNERFCLNGVPVEDAPLVAAEARVAAAIEADRADHPEEQFGEFEAWFVTALCLFDGAGCTRLVIEAGIGGRYDPCRLLQAPVTAIVSLDLEHTALLGETRAAIALDKLDAAPPGAQVFLGQGFGDVRAELEGACASDGRTLVEALADYAPMRRDDSLSGHRISTHHARLGALDLSLTLHGPRQADNALLALELARAVRPDIADEAWPGLATFALARARCAGRLEVLPGEPPILIDVGHTPAAVEAAIAAAGEMLDLHKALLLLGMSASKDVDGMLSRILPLFARVIVGAGHNGVAPHALAERVSVLRPEIEILAVCEDAGATLNAARRLCRADDVLVGLGGLFWAGALRAQALGRAGDGPDFR
ncbi:cyanophycin synthetase [uncultured Maricaulis sp.]|uniref:glutamate ligase domain-containing protein n=1 Tax=uncultured Maricaulis sp. TaxID=174710 RepID=UPI00262C65D1|nr:cyanophycin synthetase [uncultured Maricaulis sp.]